MRNPTANDNDPAASVHTDKATTNPTVDASRRRFLFTLGAGGAGAAVASAGAAAVATQVAPEPSIADDARYRVTDHVRDYYRSAKT
jgi:hypothetical protein